MSNPNLHPLIIHKSVTTTTMVREYRKGNWTLQETLTLITAKKLDDERRLKTTARNSGGSSGELRWKWVENYCWRHGCLRSQNQCNDKWDNLLRDYKKVREYEAKASDNNNKEFPSYWTMEKHQRKELKLPSNMLLQVYQAVTQVLQRKSSHVIITPLQPVPLLIASSSHDTSPVVATQPPPLSIPPPPPPPPLPPPPQPVSESSGTEYNDEDDNSESKRRKFEKLGSSIMHSASELAQALGSCEEKKEKRHQEMMQLQQLRLQMEETRNQMNQQEYTNLVSAVTNLTGVIQSLITSMTKANSDACSS
ncbi:formin-binding protein 4 isoform X2 [Cajanus cajan]|uniref:formin-binding protein 4 isoform X2 n=1 Tax=Cajanus cajan TaxID=3821 RepID=UPI0010FAECDB|nr:formin-binding protein 4 isoform X2 [Cajanus cajan]